ncbi:MAG: hypothetical protein Q4B69_08345, partial [Slackia sp.]|nr:hypothetical protein [Slackia sp.]
GNGAETGIDVSTDLGQIQSDAGMLMGGGSVEDSFAPVKNANTDLRGLYDKAVERGCKVTLHSASELAAGEARMKACKEGNRADVADAELHPGRGAAGVPASRLLHRERKRR